MMTPRAFGLGVLALLAATACRPREGERCICAGDCARGLVCAADGAQLRGGQCVADVTDDLESGVCVAGDVSSDDDVITPPPKFDAGSWATSGQVPITTAGQETDGEATTMPDETTSSSGGSGTTIGEGSGSSSSSSSSSGSAESSSGGSSSSSSSSSGTAGDATM